MKTAVLLFTLVFGTIAMQAQTTKDNLQKVKADPTTKDRAAKADVYVVKKEIQIATDTTSRQVAGPANSTSNKKKKNKGKIN